VFYAGFWPNGFGGCILFVSFLIDQILKENHHKAMKLTPYLREKNGKKRWIVQFTDPKTGARRYKQTSTKKDMDAWIKQFRAEQEALGKDALEILSDHRVRADFMDAYERLSSFHVGLTEVIDFYISHHKIGAKLKDVVTDYMKQKKASGIRDNTLRNIQNGLNQVMKAFGEREINSITSIEFNDWMYSLDVTVNSKAHYRTLAFGLFDYAFKRNIVEKNIIEKVDILKKEKKEVKIYDRETVEKFISESEGETRLFVAIGAYTGIRPEEIGRLTWDLFSKNTIHITREVSKTGEIRNVEILPNLRPFLKDREKEGSLFSVENFGDSWKFKNWRKGRNWIQDGFRKTYASHHIAAYENVGKTVLQLGHEGNPRMFHKSYYKPGITKEEGRKYFGIVEEPEQSNDSKG